MLEALTIQQKTGGSGFVKTFLGFFVAQYLAVKCYRIFLYPYYFSPLRHLPGPTVSTFDTLTTRRKSQQLLSHAMRHSL